jgi:hypothetical protein
MNISKNDKISIAITSADGVAATTDIEGEILDMSTYEGVLMAISFGVITGSAVTSIKAQESDLANMSDAVDLIGTGQTIADDDDEKTFYIEIYKPLKRYIRLYVVRGTQNAVVASATYIQTEAKKKPVTHGTGVEGELHISPIAGTA